MFVVDNSDYRNTYEYVSRRLGIVCWIRELFVREGFFLESVYSLSVLSSCAAESWTRCGRRSLVRKVSAKMMWTRRWIRFEPFFLIFFSSFVVRNYWRRRHVAIILSGGAALAIWLKMHSENSRSSLWWEITERLHLAEIRAW